MTDETTKTTDLGKTTNLGKWALAAALVVAGVAVGMKLYRPATPANVSTAAVGAADADPLEALRAKAEQSPGDGAVWQALGDAYFARGMFVDAATAFERATQAAPGTALGWSSLGEARVMASEHDPMPAPALAAFQRAAALDAKDPRARYFLAVQRDLTGDHAGAIADWLALLADTPPGAPWESDLRRTIEQVGKINKIAVAEKLAAVRQPAPSAPLATRAIAGPSPEDLRAATAIPPSEQREMAEAMVARLDARLQSQPKDVAGWVMLMRSRVNLGQPDKASAALRQAIAANPAQAEELRQQAGVLGVR
ncbi:MAG TPA: tetratricopeptide repeat protein [Novosphingobium sp.]|nr:tetratricopeptide repeat protein [Novosphingobium sp.]